MFPAAVGGPFSGPGLPRGGANGTTKRGGYASYASSIISQDAGPSTTDGGSVLGGSGGGGGGGSLSSSLAYSQSDRLHHHHHRRARRSSFSSSVAGASDVGSVSPFDYKSQDEAADMDDVKSQYAGTQSGVTVF